MARLISPEKARQGRRGRRVLLVLVAALVLALAAWGVAEFYGQAIKTPATEQGPVG